MVNARKQESMSRDADRVMGGKAEEDEISLMQKEILNDAAPDVPFIDLSAIDWPTVQYFGPDHHQKTAILASHIGRFEGLEKDEVNALWCAGSFHDLYRTKPFGMDDPGHHVFAANFIRKFLRETEYWNQTFMIDQCCWLIANQDRTENDYANNKVMQCLTDAEKFEVCRIEPGTPIGAGLIKKVCAKDNLSSVSCKHTPNLRKWMTFRGWK